MNSKTKSGVPCIHSCRSCYVYCIEKKPSVCSVDVISSRCPLSADQDIRLRATSGQRAQARSLKCFVETGTDGKETDPSSPPVGFDDFADRQGGHPLDGRQGGHSLTLWLARNHRCDTRRPCTRDQASEAEATPLLELARRALRRRRDPCPRMLQHHLGD